MEIQESALLSNLYHKYNIESLEHGILGDYLGDVYEEFILEIFKDLKSMLTLYVDERATLEREIIDKLFSSIGKRIDLVNYITTTNKIPKRASTGNSKTDVLVTITFISGEVLDVPISVKQTKADKVAMAEFDVDTICREVGIKDSVVKELMLKHQNDMSAKYFSKEESELLTERLQPYAARLVRWVVTMSANIEDKDIRYPKYIIRFDLEKSTYPYTIKKWDLLSTEEYITKLMTPKGKRKIAGFGTGLSWTYASGSGNTKIQFKG